MTNKFFSSVDGNHTRIASDLPSRCSRLASLSIVSRQSDLRTYSAESSCETFSVGQSSPLAFPFKAKSQLAFSRQSLLPILLLCLTLFIGAGQMWATDPVASATPSNNKEVVIAVYTNNKYYALPTGTVSSSTISGTEVALNNSGKVSSTNAAGKTWTLEEGTGDNAGKYYFKYKSGNSTYYLYKNGTNGTNYKFAVGSNKNYWSFTTNGTGYTVTAIGRGENNTTIQYNSGAFRCYSSASSIILLEVAPAGPTITTSSSMSTFGCNMTNGVPNKQSFKVSGAALTANVTVTPPTGYEVCLSENGTYTSSVTLNKGTGTLAATDVYVKLKDNNAAGSYSGNITCESTGATTQNVAVSGSTPFKVTWQANGQTHATTYVAYAANPGTEIGTFPDDPDPDDYTCSGTNRAFYGWFDGNSYKNANTAPTIITTSTKITSSKTFNAIFADASGGSSTTKWVLTARSDIDAGTYALMTGDYRAFNGTISSGKGGITTNAFSFTNGEATSAPTGTCEIEFQSVSGGFKLYNSSNGYLYATEAKSGKLAWHASESSYWKNASSNWTYNSNSARLRSYNNTNFNTYSDNTGNAITFAKKITVSTTTYSNYATTCCTPLVSIKGSFNGTTPTSTTFTFGTTTGAESYQVKVANSSSHPDWTTTTSPVTITGLTAGGSYTAQFRAHDTNGSNCTEFSDATSFAFTTPLITASANITGLDYAEGGTCTAQSFTVNAVGLTGNLTVTAPTNFEVSTTSATTGFGSSVTLTASGENAYNKTITNQTVYVRLAGSKSIGNYNGNVTISGGSAANNTSVSLSGTVSSSCTAPEITGQPTGVTCNLNEAANLSVTATGTDVEYQWYTCEDALKTNASAIEGAQSYSYSAPTNATGTKYYYCVTKSGACPTPSNVVAVTVNTPNLTVSKTEIAYGYKAIDGSYEETFTVSGSNLASGAAITIARTSGSDRFTIDQSSISQTSAGTVAITTIKVTYAPTAKYSHSAILTISSTGAESKTISLTGSGRWQATFLDGEGEVHERIIAESTAPAMPETNPTSCDPNSTTFIGWTQTAWSGKKPQSYIDGLTDADVKVYKSGESLPTMTSHMTYYPVFASGEMYWGRVTSSSLSSLAAGDKLVIVAVDQEYVLKNDLTCTNSVPAESEGKITVSDNSFIWELAGSSNAWQLKSGNDVLGTQYNSCAGSGNGLALTFNTNHQTYTIATSSHGTNELYIKDNSCSEGVLTKVSKYDGFRIVTTSSYSSAASAALKLYKKQGSYSDYMTTCCDDLDAVVGTVACTSGTAATLSWSAVSGAESYKVKVPGSSSHDDWTTATSGVSVTGLTAGEDYTAYFQAFDENGSNCPEGPQSTTAFTTPKITVIGTPLNPMAYAEGQGPSSAQSFKVTGKGLTGNLTVAAPTNFEICLTESETPSDWKSGENTLTIAKATAEADGQWVYVRMLAGLSANTNPSGNVTINGGNAAEVTVAVSGSVSTACENPTITGHPAGATYNMNVTATALSVAATKNGSGPALTYQWYWNTTNDNTTGTLISGEESNSYTPATSAAGTKYYYCVVSSGACSATSNCAAITVNAPSVVVSESSIAFGAKKIGGSFQETFTVSGSNLANGAGIGLAITDGKFTIDKTSVSQTSAGAVSETTITVTYSPDVVGAHNATITISSTGVANKTLTLSGTGRYEDTYKTALHSGVTTWSSYATGVVMAGNGYNVPNPGDIAAGDREGDNCQGLHYHFAGWVTDAHKEAGEISENIIPATGTKNANNTTYWAVWQKETSAGTGGTESVTWHDRYGSTTTDVEGSELSVGTNVKVTHNKRSGGTTGCKYYDPCIRVYGGGNFVVTAPTAITEINLTFGTGEDNNTISANTGTYTANTGTWEGSATSVTFTLSGTSGNRRIASMSVTYGNPAVYGDPRVECLACTATANAGTAAVDATGNFTTSSIAVKATSVSAGANCSLTDYGFVWSSSVTTPTLVEATGDAASNCVKVQVGTNNEVTSFTGALTGSFSAGAPIYVRSYAKNENASGTYQYSDVLTVTPRQVSFNMHDHGGDAPASQFVNNGAKATAVSDPSEAGWIFNGWWDNAGYTGDAWDFASNTVSGGNVELHAKWSAKTKYTITLNAGNGTVSVAGWTQDGDVWKQEQAHGDAAITFPSANAGCAGWVFQGWKEGSAVTDASSFTADKNADDELVPTSNVTYYAVYRQNATGGTTYNKITNAGDLTTGDYMFVSNTGYAMKNEVDGTEMKEQGNGISNGASNTTSDAALVWTIVKFNNKVAIKNGNNYLGINDGNNICLTTTPYLFTYTYNTTYSRWEFTSVSKTSYQLIYNNYFKIGTSQSTAVLLYKQGAGMTGNYFTNPSCDDLTITGVADPAAGGTVLLSAASAKAGDKVYAYYEVDNAYKFDNWSIAGEDSELSSTSAQLTEITVGSENTTVTANFTAKAIATVKFYNNGVQVGSSQEVVEGDAPIAPTLTNGIISGDACDETSDMHYGWTTATWVSTKDDLSDYTVYANGEALPAITEGDNDATFIYNAIWAEGTQDALEPHKKIQTLQYDTWTYSGSTTDKGSQNPKYRMFHTDSYIESEAFDRSQLSKVIVYGGTFGGTQYNSLTIGDGENVWKNVTVSGADAGGQNEYTGGTALSGVGTIRIISTCGSNSGSGTGVRISKVEIYVPNYTYSKFRTACCTPLAITPDVDEEVGKHIEADKSTACAGEVVTISKTETGYYNFGSWNVTYVDGDEQTQTVSVTNNQFEMPAYPVTVSAHWSPKNYIATVNDPDASLGSVEVSGGSIDQGVRYVAYGSTLTVEATPADDDHYFSNWTITTESGSTTSSSNPLYYTMPGSDVMISANFGEVQYPALTVGTSENYTLVAKLANDEDIPDMSFIRSGTALKVTFEPNGQYEVTEWSLNNGVFTDFDINGNVITFNMPDVALNVDVTARAYYELNLLTPENGSNDAVVIAGEPQSVTSLYRVYAGNEISVTAVPTSSSYKFDEWQLEGTAASFDGTSATATLTVGSENLSLKAVFVAKTEYTLTLTALGHTHATINALEGSSMYELVSSADAAPRLMDQEFLGWSQEEDNANKIISQSADLPLNSDYELYAVYQEKAHFYRKVTDNEALTDGQYLIVYEAGNVAFNGGLETLSGQGNTIAVTIDEETIAVTSTTTAAEFTITTKEGGFSILSASDQYIGRSTNDNGLDVSEDDDYTNTISINSNDDADIVSTNAHLRFNSASNELRFRYFKSGTYSAQKAIQLYKRDAPGENKSMPTLIVTTTIDTDEMFPDGQAGNIVVEAGGKLTVSSSLNANNVFIESEAGASGQIMGATNLHGSDLYMDVTFYKGATALNATTADRWYMISAPFDVNLSNGFFQTNGTPMVFGTDFDLFEYDGSKRATTGTTGWKRAQGKMKAGVACLIGFNADQPTTIRLKAASAVGEPTSIALQAFAGDDDNQNWNGVANPTLHYTDINKDVQTYNNEDGVNGRKYIAYAAGSTSFVVGTAFFVQETGSIDLGPATHDQFRAPKRAEANERYEACVRLFRQEATEFADQMYVRASESAMSEYEQGHDMITWNDATGKTAMIWAENYGMRLAIEEAPLVNDKASYELGIFAPAEGAYRIEANDTYDNAALYLTYNGKAIWNLSMSACELNLAKGLNEGYGLRLVAKMPQTPTGIESISDEGLEIRGAQKIVLEDKVFILRGGKMYDVTGKAVR